MTRSESESYRTDRSSPYTLAPARPGVGCAGWLGDSEIQAVNSTVQACGSVHLARINLKGPSFHGILNSSDTPSPSQLSPNYIIVLPVMERVPKGLGRETREERGSFRSERTGPPVGGRPLSTVPVTPAPCGADPVSRPRPGVFEFSQTRTQTQRVFRDRGLIVTVHARPINRARHTA